MSKSVAPALRQLLDRFIDYAGMFPPAALSLETALLNFNNYRDCAHTWMLHSFVLPAVDVPKVPSTLHGSLAVLTDNDNVSAASIESKKMVQAQCPVYCEVSPDDLFKLEQIQRSGCFAKIRTGGLKPDAIPTVVQVAAFINACAKLRLPFKATAGLHHPVRGQYPLTYEIGADKAVMHGFLNVLMAAAFAWHGQEDIEPILLELEPAAFVFDDHARWRNKSLSAKEIQQARELFIHSIGSCSFEEPVAELRALGFL